MTQDEKPETDERFDRFSDRLEAVRRDHLPPESKTTAQANNEALGLAWRLASELIAALAVGGLLGFGADTIFGTLPLFLLIGLALGCAAALLSVMRLMKKLSGQSPDPGTGQDER